MSSQEWNISNRIPLSSTAVASQSAVLHATFDDLRLGCWPPHPHSNFLLPASYYPSIQQCLPALLSLPQLWLITPRSMIFVLDVWVVRLRIDRLQGFRILRFPTSLNASLKFLLID
ncbi:unnamed protein product [Brassica oleracea var. botrytis]